MPKFSTNCVYRIKCTANSQIYVGRSINAQTRQYQHFTQLRAGKHSNKGLQSDFDRYGESMFEFEVIESGIPDMDVGDRETYWIKFHNSFLDGYNLNEGDNFHRMAVTEISPSIIPIGCGRLNARIANDLMDREAERNILDWPLDPEPDDD